MFQVLNAVVCMLVFVAKNEMFFGSCPCSKHDCLGCSVLTHIAVIPAWFCLDTRGSSFLVSSSLVALLHHHESFYVSLC